MESIVTVATIDAELVTIIDYPNNKQEGIEYDALGQRLVLSSLTSGRVIGIPLPAKQPIASAPSIAESQVHQYFAGSEKIYATSGLEVDKEDRCRLFAGVGFGAATKNQGVAVIDLCASTTDSALVQYISLGHLASSASAQMMNNDMLLADGVLWVTDFLGGHVLKVPLGSGRGTSDWRTPDPSVSRQAKIEFLLPAPNGIESFIDRSSGHHCLIVSSYTQPSDGQPIPDNYLYRYDTMTGKGQRINEAPGMRAVRADGILFDPANEILFASGVISFSVTANASTGALRALYSRDGWQTVQEAASINAHCPKDSPTASVLVDSDLYITCSGGFGAGPYAVSRVRDASLSVFLGTSTTATMSMAESINIGTASFGSVLLVCVLFLTAKAVQTIRRRALRAASALM